MSVIVDTNCFAAVFNPQSVKHAQFKPVYKWVLVGSGGKLIVGGTKYLQEINYHSRTGSYRRLLGEIARKNRLIKVDDYAVDAETLLVRARAGNDPAFDDEHIAALVAVSKCRVVCTNDARAVPYLRRKDIYPVGVKPPKIYQSARNSNLCSSKNRI